MDQQSTAPCQLTCRFCNKLVKSKSGLTNHEKICPNREEENVSTVTAPNPYDRLPPLPPEPPECTRERPRTSSTKPAKSSPFQIGAFLVMADYIPILLDVDFCIALGNHILEHGSPNSAIMAFAHQLNKLDGD